MIRKHTSIKSVDSKPCPDNEYVDRETAAQILGIKSQTLATWASTGRYPLRYFKVGGRRVRYLLSDILAFIAQGAKENTNG